MGLTRSITSLPAISTGASWRTVYGTADPGACAQKPGGCGPRWHICADDLEALDWLDQATTRKPGRKKRTPAPEETQEREPQEGLFQEEREIQETVDIINNCRGAERPTGTARTYALRRLRKHKPDIHARVLAGELSPRQGMIEAGFVRQPTPLDYLHRYWRQVAPKDRARFLMEIPTTSNERRLIALGLELEEGDAGGL